MNYINKETGELNVGKIIKHSIIGLIVIVTLLKTFGTVSAGERGVLLQLNAVTGKVYGEGLYVKVPYFQNVKKMNVQVQKEQVDADSSSKDLQSVHATIALNYRVDASRVRRNHKG